METGPKVASTYLTNPALYDGKKFDLRYVVLLKSVQPLELYVFKVIPLLYTFLFLVISLLTLCFPRHF